MTNKEDNVRNFIDNIKDFGKEPASKVLTDDQKKLAALSMAMNAAVIQFILEGIIPLDQQLHFMSHLQDFAARIYGGEDFRMEGVTHTLQVNSKAGNLFYDAVEDALKNGHENYLKIKRLSAEAQSANPQTEQNIVKPTVH